MIFFSRLANLKKSRFYSFSSKKIVLRSYIKSKISISSINYESLLLKFWHKLFNKNPILAALVSLSILTENYNNLINFTSFAFFDEKIENIKLLDFKNLIRDLYHQKDIIKNDIIITTIIIDCIKIVIFIYNFEFSRNKSLIYNKFEQNMHLYNTKFVKKNF